MSIEIKIPVDVFNRVIGVLYQQTSNIYSQMLEDQEMDMTFISPHNIPDIIAEVSRSILQELESRAKSGIQITNLENELSQKTYDFDSLVDKIFVVNLDKRNDRWDKMKLQLEKHKITNYERFSAIEPSFENIPSSHYNNMNLEYPKMINCDLDKYRTGACGCKYSHVEIVKEAKKRGYKRIMVLEDDAEIINNIYELPVSFEMVMLAGTFYEKINPVSPNYYLIKRGCLTTLGYILDESVFDLIINEATESGLEIDVFYRTYIHSREKTYIHNPHILRSIQDYSDVIHQETNYDVYGI